MDIPSIIEGNWKVLIGIAVGIILLLIITLIGSSSIIPKGILG